MKDQEQQFLEKEGKESSKNKLKDNRLVLKDLNFLKMKYRRKNNYRKMKIDNKKTEKKVRLKNNVNFTEKDANHLKNSLEYDL